MLKEQKGNISQAATVTSTATTTTTNAINTTKAKGIKVKISGNLEGMLN